VNVDGNADSACVTSAIASRVTAVCTSGTSLSAPPRTRPHAPPKVLGRGGEPSLLATTSSASSAWRLAAAISSLSSTVMAASPPGDALAAS